MAERGNGRWKRRDFIRGSLIGLAGLPALKAAGAAAGISPGMRPAGDISKTRLALVATEDRAVGVKTVLDLLGVPSAGGEGVFIKPNFNTSDPTPGSTHNDTLSALVRYMQEHGSGSITVGDRSGPEPTSQVFDKKGILDMASDLRFEALDFSALDEQAWAPVNRPGFHWDDGFFVPRIFLDSRYIVSTCCLKTHQFGGIFTMSLKNSVGVTPKKLMQELHGKRQTDMRRMIAEINAAYTPRFILMDGIDVFVDGGPMTGSEKKAGVMIAGTDRVAVDAAGLAVLRHLGSNDAVMNTSVFKQEQIVRAVELGLGVSSPDQIEFITGDEKSRDLTDTLKSILAGQA
ncbi:MAG: DUF362 domain-containing protein [Candidatus Aminicenantes bacterium]|nr:DUF362 domain-containing protein [Candidatus Aminicenantes bacterium]